MDMTRNIAMNECPVCGMAKNRMERHLVDVHGYSQAQISEFKAQKKSRRIAVSGKPIYNCEFCDATFNSISGLCRHKGTKHAEYSPRLITCPICRETVKNHRELAEHAHQQHANDADDFVVETINFQSLQDYQSWRLASEESGVISRFTAKSETTEFGKTTYLRCHCSFRAGSVPAKTKKSVEYCTAYMNVREKTDGVTVEHCLTHIGHEARPSQLRLDNNAEQFIVSLLRDGLTVRQVYKKVRMQVRGGLRSRLYFITPRDIRNIASKCRVSVSSRRATLMYAKSGRRSHRDDVSSVFDGEVENEHNGPYRSDGDEEMMEVVVVDDVENESVARNSTDVEDRHKDMFQRMEMMYASARESMLKVMREPTEGTGMEIEQVLQQMDELTKRLGLLAENVGRNGDTARLARRHDVPPVGCPQALTPIRKLHKRAHLRKAEQAKRKPVLDIPDCAQDERDACAVCLRMQPITGSTNHRICWIQCPTCQDWMHADCISNNVCPRDGAELRRSDV